MMIKTQPIINAGISHELAENLAGAVGAYAFQLHMAKVPPEHIGLLLLNFQQFLLRDTDPTRGITYTGQ